MNHPFDKIRQHTLHFFSGTLLSRLSGYLRDVAMAYSFGAHPLMAIFLVGFRTSNLPRRLFGEGALQTILIARYQQEHLGEPQEGEQRMLQLRADCHKTWSLTLLAFIALALVLISSLNYLLAAHLDSRYSLILTYTCLMLPGLWFICMSALNDAFLKLRRRFFIGSIAPAAFNLIWVLLSLSLRDTPLSEAATWLSCGIVIAYFTQWLVTYAAMRQEIGIHPYQGHFLSPQVRRVLKPLLQGLIGVGATQINGLIDALFAIEAEAAGPTYLWFAIRIEQAPLALIGAAIASASLPALSAALGRGEQMEARSLFDYSASRMISYMLATCSAMMCLAFIGVRLALERGDFSPYDSLRTAQCLWGYSLGLMGQGLLLLYQNLAFSLHCYALVTRSCLYTVLFNLLGNYLCIVWLGWGAPAIAVVTSLATLLQLQLIKGALEKRHPLFRYQLSWGVLAKVVLLYVIVFAISQLHLSWIYQLEPVSFLLAHRAPASSSLLHSCSHLLQLSVSWALLYGVAAWWLGLPLPGVQARRRQLSC